MKALFHAITLRIRSLTLKEINQLIIVLILLLLIFFIGRILAGNNNAVFSFDFDRHFFLFVLAGFMAQLVDGALGMAYGVCCSSLLIAFHVPPVISSASVHISEVFTTGISALSHLKLKNVHRQLLIRLVIPGILGSALGAFLLSNYLSGDWIKVFVSAYLMILGLSIFRKAFIKRKQNIIPDKYVGRLAVVGGFFDAIGGGGWGPIVVSNLIHQGVHPRRTIGSANTAEFFVSFVSSAVFMLFIKIGNWQPLIGILLGGILAAPLAAYVVKLIRTKPLMVIVGLLVTIISIYNIYSSIPMLKKAILAFF